MEFNAILAKPEMTFEENLCALYEEGESFGIPSDVKFLLRGMGATRKTICAHKVLYLFTAFLTSFADDPSHGKSRIPETVLQREG